MKSAEITSSDEGVARRPVRPRPGALDDRVLRQEPGEADVGQRDADAGDRQRPDQHRPVGLGDLVPQPAVVAHVLLVVHRGDDRAGAEEQHRLEEGVGEEVEHRRRIGADARRHEHVAELRAGRVGDHPLDVVLHQPDRRREEGGRRADEGDEGQRVGRPLQHRRHAADEEHPRRHHRRRMDQGGDRRRAFHRVRQPGVQEELRRLAHRADEEQQRGDLGRVPLPPEEAASASRPGSAPRRRCRSRSTESTST